jgi:phosphoribosylformylglycinamidine cyclo-ligase
MLRTFNCGIGMIVVAQASKADEVEQALRAAGESLVRVGQIIARDGEPVVMSGKLKL